MILDEIEAALKTLGMPVFYGMQGIGEAEEWNYIVFSRPKVSRSQSKHSKTKYFTVAVVCEGFVPDDFDDEVEAAMRAVPGVRLASDDIEFDYVRKPNTGVVVELMAMRFYVAGKR